ncbi:hypothetical protein [Variovorax sp. Sphag1AA]|uniref:hypothetical protein n=1 Tax=Variovorax sp. Sphag1AA TaxID=2587027 RepID=UPI0016145F93|nr:hypothetical protein [Variovorax sp. Sphag1AA]MBB3181266.1 hypothetical protein [Variovorax sp. Sphag1AA]
MAVVDYPRKPTTVFVAVVLLSLALAVDLVSWLIALNDLPGDGQVYGLMVVGAVMLVVAYLLWQVVGRARWAAILLSVLLVVLELPNLLDLVTGGIDQPVAEGDLLFEGVEAVLCLVGVALLWTKPSRNWFFPRVRRVRR